MSNVRQYVFRDKYVTVRLKDGTERIEVKIYPDPLDPHSTVHILENKNGDTERIRTVEIKGVYR